MMNPTYLVIDDDPTFNAVLVRSLTRRNYKAYGCLDARQAVELARRLQPQRIVLDLDLAGSSGLALITPILEAIPTTRITVLTGYASIATAVEAVKLGAVHYLAKPVDIDTLLAAFNTDDAPKVSKTVDSLPLSVDRVSWEHIQRVLHDHGGNISATARALKLHRRTLQRKLSKHPPPS